MDDTPVREPEQWSGPDPLWSQTADLIQQEIAARGLLPGAKLPPERELSTQLGISRITLRKSLSSLAEQGIVTASHGRGWFLAAPVPEREWPNALESFTTTALRKHLRPSSIVLRQELRPASHDEAETLGVPAGAPLLHLERVRLLNDVRIASERTLLVGDCAAALSGADFSTASLFEELRLQGVELARSEASIEARGADAPLAERLGIEPSSAVLVLDQTIYTRDQRPILLSRVEYSGDRYRLRTTFHPR